MTNRNYGWRRLKERREQLGFSKTSLAQAVGVTTTCVWNWEQANTTPRPGAFAKLANVLKTSEAWLRAEDSEDDTPPSLPSETRDDLLQRVKREIAMAENVRPEQVRITIEL